MFFAPITDYPSASQQLAAVCLDTPVGLKIIQIVIICLSRTRFVQIPQNSPTPVLKVVGSMPSPWRLHSSVSLSNIPNLESHLGCYGHFLPIDSSPVFVKAADYFLFYYKLISSAALGNM